LTGAGHITLCQRLHRGLEIDRISCSRFLANRLRGLLSAAACVLYQELRLFAARTGFRCAQVSTLREHLMKLGAPGSNPRCGASCCTCQPLPCAATIGRSSPEASAPRPHSAVGLTLRKVDRLLRESRRTPVIEIKRQPNTVDENQWLVEISPAESPAHIDFTPRYRQTWTHEHDNPSLQA
jgi:hypothetical protein